MVAPRQFCNQVKWRVIPFLVFFVITVGVLLGVYRLRTNANSSDKTDPIRRIKTGVKNRGRNSKHNWEEMRTNDRWLIVSDDQDLSYVCALMDVATELEWRTLVVGSNVTCCSSRRGCLLLNSAKLSGLHYDIQSTATRNDSHHHHHHHHGSSWQPRNVAYLYAMQHGARHIFDAYPETYAAAGIDVEAFRREMSDQLGRLALNVALGLVSERPYVRRVNNPYAHFGRPHLWTDGFRRNHQRHVHNHRYRICEVRPPSIEKFLETDDGFFDRAAPALTLPGTSVAPFSSRNVLYSIEAFWGLFLFPMTELNAIPPHLFRTLWNQAVLGDIAGSMKLSLSNISTIQRREKGRKDPSGLRELDSFTNFLLKWTCSTRSSLACIRDLTHNLVAFQYVPAASVALVDSWISDLQKLGYLEPPVIPRRRGYMNPCLGADGLNGVSFYPALATRSLNADDLHRRNSALERYLKEETLLDALQRVRINATDHDEAASAESSGRSVRSASPAPEPLESLAETSSVPLIREFTDRTCPGYSQLIPHQAAHPMHNVLLIVAMTTLRYDLIPFFEVLYRHQFPNLLYCGAPHDSIEIYLRKYQLSEERSFSFLPVHTKYTYECVMGALEMGFNVDGYLMTTDDALINTWNIPALNTTKLWYGGDYNIQVDRKEWKSLDPGGQKLPRSLEGTQKVLEFLRSSLIGTTEDRYDYRGPQTATTQFSARNRRDAELSHSPAGKESATFLPLPDLRSSSGEKTSPSAEFILPQLASTLLPDGLKLPLASKQGVLFDVVELKSIGHNKEGLPSLKYDTTVDTQPPSPDTNEEAVISLIDAISKSLTGDGDAESEEVISLARPKTDFSPDEPDFEEAISLIDPKTKSAPPAPQFEEVISLADSNSPEPKESEQVLSLADPKPESSSAHPSPQLVDPFAAEEVISLASPKHNPILEKLESGEVISLSSSESKATQDSEIEEEVISLAAPSSEPEIHHSSEDTGISLTAPKSEQDMNPLEEEDVISLADPKPKPIFVQDSEEDDVISLAKPQSVDPVGESEEVISLASPPAFPTQEFEVISLAEPKHESSSAIAEQEDVISLANSNFTPKSEQVVHLAALTVETKPSGLSSSESIISLAGPEYESTFDVISLADPKSELDSRLAKSEPTTQLTRAEFNVSPFIETSEDTVISLADPKSENTAVILEEEGVISLADSAKPKVPHIDPDEIVISLARPSSELESHHSESEVISLVGPKYEPTIDQKDYPNNPESNLPSNDPEQEQVVISLVAPKSEEDIISLTNSEVQVADDEAISIASTANDNKPEGGETDLFPESETVDSLQNNGASVEPVEIGNSLGSADVLSESAADVVNGKEDNTLTVLESIDAVEDADDEDDAEEIEDEPFAAEPERPVPEVLRELLVATRNTTQETTTTTTTTTTTASTPVTVSTSSSPLEESSLPNATVLEPAPAAETPTDTNPPSGETIFYADDEWDLKTKSTTPDTPLTAVVTSTSESPAEEAAAADAVESAQDDKDNHPVDEPPPTKAPQTATVAIEDVPHDSDPVQQIPQAVEPTVPTVVVVVEPEPSKSATAETVEELKPVTVEVEVSEVVVLTEAEPPKEVAVEPVTPKAVSEESSTPKAIVVEVAEEAAPSKTVDAEEDRSSQIVDDLLVALQDIYGSIMTNLGVGTTEAGAAAGVDASFYGAGRTPYRLDPKNLHHFRCEKGTKLEFCKVSSEFLYQLSANHGKELRLVYDKVPLYFIPKRDQLKFYLLSNLMHQHGVTDEIAVPLMLAGLRSEEDWVKLKKSHFSGATHGHSHTTSHKYPSMDSTATVLYPTDLQSLITDYKMQKTFCLKYLLRILQS